MSTRSTWPRCRTWTTCLQDGCRRTETRACCSCTSCPIPNRRGQAIATLNREQHGTAVIQSCCFKTLKLRRADAPAISHATDQGRGFWASAGGQCARNENFSAVVCLSNFNSFPLGLFEEIRVARRYAEWPAAVNAARRSQAAAQSA